MTMYALHEDELNRLFSSMRQLNLMLDLCQHINDGATVAVGPLSDFLTTQYDSLREVINTVERRRNEAKQQADDEPGLTYNDLQNALLIAGGQGAQVPRGAHQHITEVISQMASMDYGWAAVLGAWQAVALPAPAEQQPAPTDQVIDPSLRPALRKASIKRERLNTTA